MGPLTYVVLKTVSSVMANFNVVRNPRFFMMFWTSFHVFDDKNTNEYVRLGLRLKHNFMRKLLS